MRWVELEVVYRRRSHWLASFEGCDSLPNLVVAGSLDAIQIGAFGSDRGRDHHFSGPSLSGTPLPSRSRLHEIMECADRNLKPTCFRKYVHYIPICASAAAQFVYQFAVLLQARAGRLLRQAIDNVLELAVQMWSLMRKRPPLHNRTYAEQTAGNVPNKRRTAGALAPAART